MRYPPTLTRMFPWCSQPSNSTLRTEGVKDKRFLCLESEFASVLKVVESTISCFGSPRNRPHFRCYPVARLLGADQHGGQQAIPLVPTSQNGHTGHISELRLRSDTITR